MTGSQKWGMALLFALLAAVAGLYLSGYITLMLLKLPQASLAWGTWPDYARALDLPQFALHAGKIKAAGAIGFGFPGLLWLGLLYLLFRTPPKSLHGEARFASSGDLAKKGLFKPHANGIEQWRLRATRQVLDPVCDLFPSQRRRQRTQSMHRRVDVEHLRVLRVDRRGVQCHVICMRQARDPELRREIGILDADHAAGRDPGRRDRSIARLQWPRKTKGKSEGKQQCAHERPQVGDGIDIACAQLAQIRVEKAR